MTLLRDLERVVLRGPDPPPAWMRGPGRLRRLLPGLFVMLAAGLAFAAVEGSHKGGWEATALGVLSVVPVALVSWRPLLAWRVAWIAALVGLLAPSADEVYPWHPAQIWAFLLVLLIVSTAESRGALIWVWLFTVGLSWLAIAPENQAGTMLLLTAVMVFGYQIYRRSQTQQRLVEEQERLAAEQERGIVLTERARIARELHDVVAHHMSLIAVRAETAPYRLGELPEPVRAEFGQLAGAAREAMTEMRSLLGVLRSDSPEPLTAPQPGLDELDGLLAAARAAGTQVTVHRIGDLRGLPSAVQLSAYRIVQESLSNAARHAPGAPVAVTVRRDKTSVGVRVTNAPGTDPPVASPVIGLGHGIQGMRERAAMLGGHLTAGPRADGGFEVTASLPVPPPIDGVS